MTASMRREGIPARSGRVVASDTEDPSMAMTTVDALAAMVPDGALVAMPPDNSLPSVALAKALIRKGARNLRLLGVHRAISTRTLMQHILPCLWWLFAGVILSGALLFMFMPLEYAFNPAFRLKLVLIAAGGLNALVMHLVLLRSQVMWDSHSPVPASVKLAALASLAIWMGTLACGRLIAYYYGA